MRRLTLLLLSLLVALAFPACSIFQSEAVRSQKRYDRYVRESVRNRERQQQQINRQRRDELPPAQELDAPQVQVTTTPVE